MFTTWHGLEISRPVPALIPRSVWERSQACRQDYVTSIVTTIGFLVSLLMDRSTGSQLRGMGGGVAWHPSSVQVVHDSNPCRTAGNQTSTEIERSLEMAPELLQVKLLLLLIIFEHRKKRWLNFHLFEKILAWPFRFQFQFLRHLGRKGIFFCCCSDDVVFRPEIHILPFLVLSEVFLKVVYI